MGDLCKAGDLEDVELYLERLVSCRNQNFPQFNKKLEKDEDEPLGAQVELEHLKMQEKRCLEDVSEVETKIAMVKQLARTEVLKNVMKAAELNRKTEQAKLTLVELRSKTKDLKEQHKSTILMSKDLSSRMAYPKRIVEVLLKVDSDGNCQDEEFCQLFSGGKCRNIHESDTTKEGKENSK